MVKFVELTTNANSGDGGGGIPGYTPVAINSGRQVVTWIGARVQLASSLNISEVLLVAEFTNTGTICVGGSDVVANQATREGVPLNPGDGVVITIDNINKIYIDSTAGGDGVTYLVVK